MKMEMTEYDFKVEYSEEFNTYYITYKGLDFYILSEKLNVLDWFLNVVKKCGGEVTKTGEDFFTEEDAHDALEEIEREFFEILSEAILKFKGVPILDVVKFLIVIDEDAVKKAFQMEG